MMRRKKSHFLANAIFIILLCLVGFAFYWHYIRFNPQSLVEKSALSNAEFSVPVLEIVSPKYGIKAYLFEEHSNPIISMSFLFSRAGRVAENTSEEGLANITAAMLDEATLKYDSQAFKEELENNAISLGYSADKDDFSGFLLTTQENSAKSFDLLKQTLMEARLDEADLLRTKERALIALARQTENPQTKLSLIAAQKLYGDHPYGRNPLGDRKDIAKIDAAKIRDFVAQNLGQDNLIIGIAGDITAEAAGTMLDDVFGGLPINGAVNKTADAKIDFSKFVELNNQENLAQNIAFIAAKGAKRRSSDFYPLYIANHIFGGSGLSSRLNLSAREKEGLTYNISTTLSVADKSSLLQGAFSSTQQNFTRVREILLQELQKMSKEGVSKQELSEAKQYLTSSYNLRFADISNIASMLVYMQKDNLGIDFLQKRNGYIEAVTLRQVNRAASQYFDPSHIIMINIGKF